MDKELERAYDALKQAHEAGNKEDAQQIADYIRILQGQQNAPKGETSTKQVGPDELVNKLYPTLGGAIAGEVIGPAVNKGVEAVRAPQTAAAPKAAPAPGGTPYNPRGVSIEQSVQNWENYSQAQNEAAKRVRREAELHKKYPGFTRAQPPAPPPAPTSALTQLREVIPGPVKAAGRFLEGAAQSSVVPWLGRAVAGGAAGYQGADAYNRFKQEDTLGGGLSAISALGAGASFFPHPITRYGGTAISMGAEGLNQYLDYLKKKAQQPPQQQQPQEPQQEMPVPMAQGGLVYLAAGGKAFEPESEGYDYKTAMAHGMGPDGTGEDLGHWGSVAPTSDDERMLRDLPKESYVMLKGKAHETFKKAEEAEKKRGSKIIKSGERYYSVPEYAEGGSTTPAWQRKEGKSPSGGLNAVGRASYKRETGGELKAPQPEGGSRKKSFCARMGGMKKKLTSSKTANDPDSRINKALRKWKC